MGEELIELLEMLIIFVAAMMLSYAVTHLIRKLFNKNK